MANIFTVVKPGKICSKKKKNVWIQWSIWYSMIFFLFCKFIFSFYACDMFTQKPINIQTNSIRIVDNIAEPSILFFLSCICHWAWVQTKSCCTWHFYFERTNSNWHTHRISIHLIQQHLVYLFLFSIFFSFYITT